MSEVWYAAYGSNTLAARFDCYLTGGSFSPGQDPHPGCRDASAPAASATTWVPGQMVFAGAAKRWNGGGVSFLDVGRPAATALVRLWLITLEQLVDVQAQECGLIPGAIAADLPEPGESRQVADARYGRLVHLGDHDGHQVITFTGDPPQPRPATPDDAYLATIAAGLVEAGVPAPTVDAYLRTCHAKGV